MKLNRAFPTAVLLFSVQSTAFAAEGLDCMDAAFSEQQQQSFDRFAKTFNIDLMDETPLPDKLILPVADCADACQSQLGWSDEAAEQAVIHFTAGLLEKLVQADAPFSDKDWDGLRAAYATVDKAMVRQIVEPVMNDGEPDSAAEAASDQYFGTFFDRTGIAESEKNAATVGVWLGARGMIEISAERFAAY